MKFDRRLYVGPLRSERLVCCRLECGRKALNNYVEHDIAKGETGLTFCAATNYYLYSEKFMLREINSHLHHIEFYR